MLTFLTTNTVVKNVISGKKKKKRKFKVLFEYENKWEQP